MVEETPTMKELDHGTGVCGAVLYGNLAGKTDMDEVENPVVRLKKREMWKRICRCILQ